MKKLAEIFKNQCIVGIIPEDVDNYYWYLDEEDIPIGINKQISNIERDLIELHYTSVDINKFTDTAKLQWLNFLVGKKSNKIPPPPYGTTTIKFIFFFHDFDINLQLEFESLVQSFNDTFKVLFLEPEYGVILDFSMTWTEESYEIEDFLLASKQDFSQKLTFYQTISYEINHCLAEKFMIDFDLFKKFKRTDTNLMKYKDIFLNYMISSEVLAEYQIFSDWFKQLFLVDDELLAVVKCYLESGFNVTTGSKLMHMHRNTFMNKLDRFIETTGLNIKNFDEAAIVFLLIRLRKNV